MLKIKRIWFLLLIFSSLTIFSQDIPMHISYYRIYDFLDELANEGLIDLNSAIKPYSQTMIAEKLQEVSERIDNEEDINLSIRQKKELAYFLNEFALELNQLPTGKVRLLNNEKSLISLYPPVINYKDENFKARMTPILGMHLTYNQNGHIDRRWYGADFQSQIGKNINLWGSLRDISHAGTNVLSGPTYLNNEPGYEYTFGHDFSDSRGGISYNNPFITLSFMKDNISWGDNYHCSNILSGRAPSFPMVYLKVKPVKWFELNYFHAWLVSNVIDSTYHYLENDTKIYYRPANKYMAANMFTFTPINNLKLSIGNSIVYAERNVVASYFIPIAFYKSLDHVLTKGLKTENQNSQLFFNISSRNIKHLHLYTSIFVDEFQLARLSPKKADNNPISFKIGAQSSGFPLKDLSVGIEYTRTNIINYKHSIPTLTYASNSYNLGHYLGDNSEEFYAFAQYKPIRGLDVKLYYTHAKHGNEYDYIRRGTFNGTKYTVISIISQPVLGDIIWKNNTFGLRATYEVFRNAYAVVKLEKSNIQGFDASSDEVFGEVRMTAQETLDRYTPKFMQGDNLSFTMGFSFGF